MPARTEGWVIGLSIRVAAMWCDEVIVLDHASTDDTAEIACQVAAETGKVTLLSEPNPEWAEMSHRQALLECARERGATHIALIDADEVLTANLLDKIRPMIEAVPPGLYLQIPMRNMHRSIAAYRSDRSPFGYTVTTVAFADRPGVGWRDAGGYPHHHREPYGAQCFQRIYPEALDGGVMHLQFASWRRLLAKHCLYKCSERVRFPNKPVAQIDKMYSLAPNETGLQLTDVGLDWWPPYEHLMKHLDLDREPWQEAEARRLVESFGRDHFAGLDLFGVV